MSFHYREEWIIVTESKLPRRGPSGPDWDWLIALLCVLAFPTLIITWRIGECLLPGWCVYPWRGLFLIGVPLVAVCLKDNGIDIS